MPAVLLLADDGANPTVGEVPTGYQGLFVKGGVWYNMSSGGGIVPIADVTSLTMGDGSIVNSGTSVAPVIETGTLDVIVALHPPAANWSNNSKRITSLAAGVAGTDGANVSQLPTLAPGDASAAVAGGPAYTVESGTLDKVANLHPPVAAWSNGGFKITSIANGTAAQDAAAFGQVPALPPYPLSSLATIGGDTILGNNTGTAAVPAALTIAQLNSMMNSYIDVTQQPTPVLTTNSGTTNTTNINTILAAAPAQSLIYFPPNAAVYQFQGAWTAFTKDYAFVGMYGHSVLAWANVGVTTTNLITLNASGFYTSFEGITFQTFVTMTTNSVVDCKANVNTYFVNCQFIGPAANPLSSCINFSDATNGGNGAVVSGCYFLGWTGSAIIVNGLQASPYFSDLSVIGNQGNTNGFSTNGILCTNGGAILMNDCGIVKCQVNVNITPGAGLTVASIFGTNCFLDQATQQSLLITSATGTATRIHFIGCWFTLAPGTGPTAAIQISTTGAAIHSGIEFQDCWIVNVSGTTGTNNGALITGASDFTISGCQIAGWTNGIQVTPPTTATTCAPMITNNTIGPCGGAAGNATGILLNAGAPTTYASVLITGNKMLGNTTTPLTDNSTVPAGQNKYIGNNLGVLMKGANGQLSATQASASTTQTTLLTVPVLAGVVRVGDVFEIELHGISSSTGTLAFEVWVGTTNNVPGAVPAGTVAWAGLVSAAQVANQRAGFKGLLTVRSIGAGTVECECLGYAQAALLPTIVAAATTPAVTTTAAWYITLSVACSVGSFTAQQAVVKVA